MNTSMKKTLWFQQYFFRFPTLIFMLLTAATPAFAWVGVGAPPGCEVTTVQKAIDRVLAAERAGDFSDPFIVMSGGSFNEAVTIDNLPGNAVLTMTGGYNATCQAPEAGSVSTINAAHHSGSVLTVNGAISLSLKSLQFTGANTSGNGGGIDFDGTGLLDVINVSIFGNHAGRGGGIYANGQSNGFLKVRVHKPTTIDNNSADHNGGGIRVQGNTRLFMLEGGTSITNNTVTFTDDDGAGGGIQVVGPARADIGSGIISGNSARRGGGISVDGHDNDSGNLRIFMTKPGQPTRIENNKASLTGGGIYQAANTHFGGATGLGNVCGFGFAINSNTAQEGAAIYLDTAFDVDGNEAPVGDYSSTSLVGGINSNCDGLEAASALGAIDCAVGIPCNTINDNRAQDSSGNPTDGSTILYQTGASFLAERFEMRRNVGGHLVHGFARNEFGTNFLKSCLFVDNQSSIDLIRLDEEGPLVLNNCTLSANTVGGPNILSTSGSVTITDSLLWHPGRVSLHEDDGLHGRDVENVLASEVISLGNGNTVLNLDPQFISPSSGNYHLASTSPAIDFAPALDGVDLDGRQRTVDLPQANRAGGGPLDLGAYELQGAFPPDENFNGTIAPGLPTGWVSTHNGVADDWVVAPNNASSPPNAAFADEASRTTDNSLESPAFDVPANGRVTFRHFFNLELRNDGAAGDGLALEIEIIPGVFEDIIAAGGTFVSNGYNNVKSGCNVCPLDGRSVWSGSSHGYKTVVVDLPVAATGHSVKLRWRMGNNGGASPGGGYWLDDIHLDFGVPAEIIFQNGFDLKSSN
jgi:predicted outer membrane repeat protein